METKIADSYIFESTMNTSKSDSDITPFVKKNLTYILDNQNGSGAYTSGQVIIDGTSLATSGNMFQDWSEAYVVVPYNVRLTCTATAAALADDNTISNSYLTSLKNNSIIDSITVEQGGRVIVNQTSNLSQFVNYKLHSTTSQDNVNKMGASLGYSPDGVGVYSYNASTIGVVNNANNPSSTSFTAPEAYNVGLLQRQKMSMPYTSGLTTAQKQITEGSAVQLATGAMAAGTTVLSNIQYLLTIRLKDLTNFFSKQTLTRGLGYKITLRINSGVSTFTHAATTSSVNPFSGNSSTGAPNTIITAQSFVGIGGATTQPAMLNIGIGNYNWNQCLAAQLKYAAATVISANTLTLTSQIATGSNALLNGIRLYCPSYELAPTYAEKLLSLPVLNRSYNELYFNLVQNQLPNASINVQIASGISNPKALIIIPQVAQNVNAFNSNASAFNPSPGTTDPQLSLTNTQIKLGSQYVLPDRVQYGFTQFLENNAQLFGVNGNQSDYISSGVIDYQKFLHNYRYYAYDLSRYPASQDNTPMMISLESYNNASVAVDLYVYVLYERSVEVNLVAGSIQVE